jgi:hypothetical protein
LVPADSGIVSGRGTELPGRWRWRYEDAQLTDFRVVLPTGSDSDATRELDWEREPNRWRLSEKEYGEVRWTQDLEPSASDLDFLRTFFRIRRMLDPSILAQLSPGELALLHSTGQSNERVLASLCEACGLHWTIYRLEDDGNWHRYGRTCDFVWSRGNRVDADSDETLAALLASDA